jgi:hypothetical protein
MNAAALLYTPTRPESARELADRLELEAFLARDPVRVDSVINGSDVDTLDDEVRNDDLDVQTNLQEERLAALETTLLERASTLGASYPFSLSSDHSTILWKEDCSAGASVYALCLFLSHLTTELLNANAKPNVQEIAEARRLFEAAATVAAAGIIKGPSVWFGWPREDGSAFHAKLREVWAAIADGLIVDEAPAGSPVRIKDGGIDVIAWHAPGDEWPPLFVLLGQSASGNDWKVKSISPFSEKLKKHWFNKAPAQLEWLLAHFIPFDGDRDELIYNVTGLGFLVHRLRLPRFVDVAIALESPAPVQPNGIETVPEIATWLQKYRARITEGV